MSITQGTHFIVDSKHHVVQEVLKTWTVPAHDGTSGFRDYAEIRTTDQQKFLLAYDATRGWQVAGGESNWDRPDHYGGEENPFEPIKIIEWYGLNFSLGNAIKYILRTGKKKGEPNLKELRKAYTYIGFEIRRREKLGEE